MHTVYIYILSSKRDIDLQYTRFNNIITSDVLTSYIIVIFRRRLTSNTAKCGLVDGRDECCWIHAYIGDSNVIPRITAVEISSSSSTATILSSNNEHLIAAGGDTRTNMMLIKQNSSVESSSLLVEDFTTGNSDDEQVVMEEHLNSLFLEFDENLYKEKEFINKGSRLLLNSATNKMKSNVSPIEVVNADEKAAKLLAEKIASARKKHFKLAHSVRENGTLCHTDYDLQQYIRSEQLVRSLPLIQPELILMQAETFHIKKTMSNDNIKKSKNNIIRSFETNSEWGEVVGSIQDLLMVNGQEHHHRRSQIQFYNKYLWAAIIVKNDASTLINWILWHLLLGVDKILVYDNGSTDNIQQAILPFLTIGKVEYIWFAGVGDMQLRAYNNALRKASANGVVWLMTIDVDEYMVPVPPPPPPAAVIATSKSSRRRKRNNEQNNNKQKKKSRDEKRIIRKNNMKNDNERGETTVVSGKIDNVATHSISTSSSNNIAGSVGSISSSGGGRLLGDVDTNVTFLSKDSGGKSQQLRKHTRLLSEQSSRDSSNAVKKNSHSSLNKMDYGFYFNPNTKSYDVNNPEKLSNITERLSSNQLIQSLASQKYVKYSYLKLLLWSKQSLVHENKTIGAIAMNWWDVSPTAFTDQKPSFDNNQDVNKYNKCKSDKSNTNKNCGDPTIDGLLHRIRRSGTALNSNRSHHDGYRDRYDSTKDIIGTFTANLALKKNSYDNFAKRSNFAIGVPRATVKVILKVSAVLHMDHVHYPVLKPGYRIYSANDFRTGWIHRHNNSNIALHSLYSTNLPLFHYTVRSLEEYTMKTRRGRADYDLQKNQYWNDKLTSFGYLLGSFRRASTYKLKEEVIAAKLLENLRINGVSDLKLSKKDRLRKGVHLANKIDEDKLRLQEFLKSHSAKVEAVKNQIYSSIVN